METKINEQSIYSSTGLFTSAFLWEKLPIVKGLVASLWVVIIISFSSLSVFSDVAKKSMFNTLQCKPFNAPGSNNK